MRDLVKFLEANGATVAELKRLWNDLTWIGRMTIFPFAIVCMVIACIVLPIGWLAYKILFKKK